MSQNTSAKNYHDNKERLQKKLKYSQAFLKNKKKKNNNIVVKDTKSLRR